MKILICEQIVSGFLIIMALRIGRDAEYGIKQPTAVYAVGNELRIIDQLSGKCRIVNLVCLKKRVFLRVQAFTGFVITVFSRGVVIIQIAHISFASIRGYLYIRIERLQFLHLIVHRQYTAHNVGRSGIDTRFSAEDLREIARHALGYPSVLACAERCQLPVAPSGIYLYLAQLSHQLFSLFGQFSVTFCRAQKINR